MEQDTLKLATHDNIQILYGLAEYAGIDPNRFMSESLELGVELAGIQLEAAVDDREGAFILIEQPGDEGDETVFFAFSLDFEVPMDIPDVEDELADLEFALAFPERADDELDAAHLELDVDPGLVALAREKAAALGIGVVEFIDECVFWRYELAMARKNGMQIMIRIGQSEHGHDFTAEFEEN